MTQQPSGPHDPSPVRARDVHRAIVRLVQELEAIDWYHAPIGVVALDARGLVLAWNGAAGEILGVREWEVLGTPFLKLFAEAARPELDRLIALCITTDRRCPPSVFERRAADGQPQFVEVTASGLRSRTGEPGATVLLQDVTARVSAEHLRRDAERRFRGLVQGVDAIVWEADAATVPFTFVSQRAEEILGYPLARWIAEPDFWERHLHPDDRLRVMTSHRDATVEGRDHELEYRMVAADGREVWLRAKVTVLRGDDGRPARVLGLMVDVTERKRTEETLARLYRGAEADVERKEEFLATLAHELRTPLGAITNASQILGLSGGTGPPAERAREVIVRQVRHLTRLMDELLDLATAASGKLTLDRQPVDLNEVVRHGVAALADRAAALGHEVRVDAAPAPAIVEADPVRLEQIVTNLVDNAIKYTPPRGRIVVTVARDDGHATVRVQDSGTGIPSDALARIFEPFYQAPRAPGSSGNGLGLGLALVRRLVEVHGGEITARSDGAGRGSEFVVRLPLRAPAAPPGEPLPAGVRPRVLVIDDDADTRELMSEILRRANYEPLVAEDGPRGIEAYRAALPDAVVVDIALPGLEGYDVGRSLRARPHRPGPLLIALTGYSRADEEARAREAGFDALVVKPVDPAQFTRLLADALASRPR